MMKTNDTLKLLMLVLAMAALVTFPKVHADDGKTDEEIIGILMAGDKNEIDVAKQAQSKDVNPEVKAYAQMLEKDHTADLNKLDSLVKNDQLKPPLTAGAAKRAQGMAVIAKLTPLNGKDYDKAYIDAMVKDHTDDLSAIDNDFMKDVKGADVKAQLTDTRSHIAMHLEAAKKLQK